MSDYWKICIEEAIDQVGLIATEQQIKDLAEIVESAHDNYSMAHGHDCIPNPLVAENVKLREQVVSERSKVLCKTCNGQGRLISHGPYHSSDTQCHKCNGEGRHL